jgi:hypothetical protein
MKISIVQLNSRIHRKAAAKKNSTDFSSVIESTEDLQKIILKTLDVKIPNQAVCPGHCAPMTFISDQYFEKTQDCLVIGPRNGGKTTNSAALEFMEAAKKDGCESCHLGSIMAQAKRAYRYIFNWAYRHRFSLKIPKITREETRFDSGSSIEIIPGTMNGVN